MNTIIVNENYLLDQVCTEDIPALCKWLNHQPTVDMLLRVPFPYTEKDGEWWVQTVEEEKKESGCLVNWSIRQISNGELIGGIGFHDFDADKSSVLIGYWLAHLHRRKGIMTTVIQRFLEFCFERHSLDIVEAEVFSHNQPSAGLLEKCGFKFVKNLPNHYLKNGKRLDGLLYRYTRK